MSSLQKYLIPRLLLLLLGISLPCLAGQPAIVNSNPAQDGGFKVMFQPLNGLSYGINQPIRFTVKANQDFYLHLFTVDDTGALLSILPETAAGRQYSGGQEYVVPETGIRFTVACPGKQKVIMLASTRGLAKDKAMEAVSGLSARGAMLRSKKGKKVMQEIELDITAPLTTAPLLQTDKTLYRLGDYVSVTVSVPEPGFIYLWVINPGEKTSFLARRSVQADVPRRLRLKAAPPVGKHRLAALFDQEGKLVPAQVDIQAANSGCPRVKGFAVQDIEVAE
jgi:hypothetical protein